MADASNQAPALSAEPAQEMTPTDEQVTEWAESFIRPVAFNRPIAIQIAVEAAKWVRSVIAADRASRLPEMGEGDWPELPAPEERPGGQRNCGLSAAQCRAYAAAAVEAYKALVRGKT